MQPVVRRPTRHIRISKESIMSRIFGNKITLLAIPLATAMVAAPAVHANDRMNRSGQASHSNVASSSSGKVVSGGVGIGARDSLQRQADNYELKLVFAKTPSGDYLAQVPVTITDRRGSTVIDAVSDGPWMYVDLPSGNYTVKAQFDGRTETRNVTVSSGSQRTVYVRFPEGGSQNGSMNVSSTQ